METLVFFGCQEVGESTLGYQYRSQELLIVKTNNSGEIIPIDFLFFRLPIFLSQQVEIGFRLVVCLALESYMPLGTIDITVVGLKSELAVTCLFASGKDIDAIGWCGTIVLTILSLAIDHNALLTFSRFLGIAGRTAIEGKADGVEQCGLTAACGAYDAEDIAVAKCAFFKIDHFASLTIE